jgi:CHAT domain-containing protein/tetratricopeptide (TPR) repeat protein
MIAMRFQVLEPNRSLILSVLLFPFLLSAPGILHAQSPFQFREAYLLERRMATDRGGFVDISHFEENLGRVKPTYVQNGDCMIPQCAGPDGNYVLDLDNLRVYQTGRWTNLLIQTDKARGEGAFAVAGPVYVRMIEMLRKAQGENSENVALMLDHLAEYYLEGRNFEKAYQTLEEAVKVRRATITLNSPIPPEGTTDPGILDQLRHQAHLADMLTRLGQIDMGKGDLIRAQQRLTEAVGILNQKITRRLVGSLYAVYFDSLVLERQGKWKEAEDLWKQSVALREGIELSNPYWDCLREQAAFYARHGDFHTAAEIAQRVQDGTKGKRFRPAVSMPYPIDSRPRGEEANGAYSYYLQESDTALKEILALDKWQTDGPAAGAALLPDFYSVTERPLFDLGADSELAQMIAWIEQRVFLHMSILLDGQPTQQQVETAYQMLGQVKGRYLASIGATTAYAERGRNNPGVDTDSLPIMDEMGEAREYQAQIYLEAALDKKPFRAAEFGEAENTQRILSRSLSADASVSSLVPGFSVKPLVNNVPEDAAMLDYVLWDRIDRSGKVPPRREYGVFVVRHGQPVHYVRIGPADTIDKQVDALKAGVLGNHTRGFLVETQGPAVSPDLVNQRLKTMYATVMAPLENYLQGTKQLFIVPDGKLTLAPMSGLIDGTGHFLFESRTISYLNSWRDLSPSAISDSDTAVTSVVVANPDFNLNIMNVDGPQGGTASSKRPVFAPLPGAELEARDIERALQVPAERVLVGKASRKWLVQSVTSPQILHFATHTIPSLEWKPPVAEYKLFDVPQPQISQNPLIQSMIAMAGANRAQNGPEDGILTGLEVSRLHLTGTSLVVLSTCESGQGTPVEGLGVLGLRAAFSMAGAHALVMTLWPVDDAAGRQFMKFFYSHLALGTAAALRQAQLDMVAMPQYKNPFYWSGYVLSGGPEVRRKIVNEAASVDPSAGKETFITPRCLELFMSAHQDKDTSFRVIRLKIGGVVYKKQDSKEEAIYDLRNPGNSITVRTSESTNGGPKDEPKVRGEGRMRYTGTLIVKNTKDLSGLYLRFGQAKTEVEKRELITLQTGAGMFGDLQIPESFPSQFLFSTATDSYAQGFKLDAIGACKAIPSW